MKTVDSKLIQKQMNKCYMEYDPTYPKGVGEPTMMNGFKYYLERTAGIRLEFETEIKNGKIGYAMTRVEIVDEPKFTMWLLRWT